MSVLGDFQGSDIPDREMADDVRVVLANVTQFGI